MNTPNSNTSNMMEVEESSLREIARFDFEQYKNEASDRLKYQIEFSQAILKNLFFLNGGSIIALLTFLGNAKDRIVEETMYWSFGWFTIGVALSLLALFCGFISQLKFMEATLHQVWTAQYRMHGLSVELPTVDLERSMKLGNGALFAGIALALMSLITFVIGAFLALDSIV